MAKTALLVVVLVIGCCLQQAYSAPRSKPVDQLTETDLIDKFSEFLQQDKEMAAVREFVKTQMYHSVAKRAAEDMDINKSMEPAEGQGQEGFFDRAAKFVMELLQRFLRWVNTD